MNQIAVAVVPTAYARDDPRLQGGIFHSARFEIM